MGLANKIAGFFKVERRSVESVSNYGRFPWFGVQTKSGVAVDRDSTLGLSAAYRAIWVLSSSIASLPLNVYNIENKKVTLLVADSISKLLNHRPSGLYTPFTFKQTMMTHLLIDGNCFIKKKYDATRAVTSLRILDYREVAVSYDENTEEKFFKYKSKEYTNDDIIHIVGMGFDGLLGKSPIAVSRENIGLSIASQQYGEAVFKNGVFASGAIEYPNALKDDAYERLKNSFTDAYSGLQNAGKPILLENGAKFNPIKLDVQDAMFLQQRQMTVYEIARIFGVPPHILYQLDKASFNNIESLGIEFVRYSLRPWLEMIESAFNLDLLRDDDFGKKEIRFDLDAMLRGDTASRAAFYQSLIQNGIISPNEARSREGYNEYEGGDDKFLQLNNMPVDMIREYYSKENNLNND
jgi:HK97 family phage portal protein